MRLLLVCVLLAGTAAILLPRQRVAAQGAGRVDSVFHIAKSQNRNQVHFGVRVDGACRPVGARPVYAYWRNLEVSATSTEPLDSQAARVYGIARQSVRGRHVDLALRSLPDRPITITTRSGGGGCTATAAMMIGGRRATLREAFVQLRALGLRVEYVELRGRVGSRRVTERVSP